VTVTPVLDEALASSFRRRPESRFEAFLDPGLRRGDGLDRSKSFKSTPVSPPGRGAGVSSQGWLK
jgi:hypothetical protein